MGPAMPSQLKSSPQHEGQLDSRAGSSPMKRPSATLAGGSYSGRCSSARFASALRCRAPCRVSRLPVGLVGGLSSLSPTSGRCVCSKSSSGLALLPQAELLTDRML